MNAKQYDRLEGSLCEYCGDRPPRAGSRWCSGNCRFRGQRELRESPPPEEIARRAAEIQRGWTDHERRRRRLHVAGELLDDIQPEPYTVPQFFETADGYDSVA